MKKTEQTAKTETKTIVSEEMKKQESAIKAKAKKETKAKAKKIYCNCSVEKTSETSAKLTFSIEAIHNTIAQYIAETTKIFNNAENADNSTFTRRSRILRKNVIIPYNIDIALSKLFKIDVDEFNPKNHVLFSNAKNEISFHILNSTKAKA